MEMEAIKLIIKFLTKWRCDMCRKIIFLAKNLIILALTGTILSMTTLLQAMATPNTSVSITDTIKTLSIVGSTEAVKISPLSTNEVTDLLHMREEEKLARDVYLALFDKWGTRVFQNIAMSEQKHMEAIGSLLKTYGIDDPVMKTGDARGIFVNPNIQSLYNKLVTKGSNSLVDALTVGATIEDLDIKDLNEAITHTTHNDIRQVYENLKMGSKNHMRAFVSNLRALGADYEPQYISTEEFQKILTALSGNGKGCGRKNGGNRGRGNKMGKIHGQSGH